MKHQVIRHDFGPHHHESARQRARRALEGLVGVPFTEGNRVDVLRNGVEIFPAMLDAIRSATRSVEFLTYVYWTGGIAVQFAEALSARAREGVRVRVLLDAYGASQMNDALVDTMEAAGVDIGWFRPLSTWKFWQIGHRTHRKVLICDGRVAFTGGVGIAEEWEGDARSPGEWRDTHFRVRGPAVNGLRAAFLGNWSETGRVIDVREELVPPLERRGDVSLQVVRSVASVGWSDIATQARTLLSLAEQRIRVTTAYFAPDAATTDLLCGLAGRGVDVTVLIPGPYIDNRASEYAGSPQFRPLMEAGVSICAYQPTMIHAKVMTIDGILSAFGSANFNQRSMRQDDEIFLIAEDEALAATLDGHFDDDLAKSEPFDLDAWERRGAWRRLKEWLATRFKRQV